MICGCLPLPGTSIDFVCVLTRAMTEVDWLNSVRTLQCCVLRTYTEPGRFFQNRIDVFAWLMKEWSIPMERKEKSPCFLVSSNIYNRVNRETLSLAETQQFFPCSWYPRWRWPNPIYGGECLPWAHSASLPRSFFRNGDQTSELSSWITTIALDVSTVNRVIDSTWRCGARQKMYSSFKLIN